MNIIEAMGDRRLFGPMFECESWDAWRVFLAALFGLKLSAEGLEVYRRHTGRETQHAGPHQEAWVIAGRRGGKSRIAALVATYVALFRDYSGVLARGERGVVSVLAADRRQARTIFRYVEGLVDAVAMLSAKVASRSRESISFDNGIDIEIHTSSYRSVRGYTIVAAILDEVAFWHSDDSANPDTEILRALRPSMATVEGALLLAVSTPYARRGEVWRHYDRHHGRDSSTLVWCAPTRAMNPLVAESVIEAAQEDDPLAAAAEFGAEFRRDVESFLSPEAIEAVVAPRRHELAPRADVEYVAFTDPSGGSRDSYTLAVAHLEGERAVLDALREREPPFSPEGVTEEYATLIEGYGVRTVAGDRYAGEWPREQFAKHGITYEPCERSKSELYLEFLPAVNSGRVVLLDNRRLRAQLERLERRTWRGGKDSVDHPPKGRDDLANAAAGALVEALATAGDGEVHLWFAGEGGFEDGEFEARVRERGHWFPGDPI